MILVQSGYDFFTAKDITAYPRFRVQLQYCLCFLQPLSKGQFENVQSVSGI